MEGGTLVTALGLGFALGLRHALDPDHLVAVSTIVGEHRSLKRSSLVGAFWGLGHTASLLLAAVAVIALKLRVSETSALWMEFAVALMLVALGARALGTALRGWRLHAHAHTHGGRPHVHLHLHRPGEGHARRQHRHRHLLGLGARPFAVGMVHGMAGSAGLMLLVLATIPSAVAGLAYVGVFGLGSVGGMLVMSGLLSLPFILTAKRFGALGYGLQLATGLLSLSFGLLLVWRYGFGEHLIY
jgi:ABC-type nickel/cobalt efflux system permease component RcnA